MIKKIKLFIALVFLSVKLNSQVGINTTSLDPSSILDVYSTNKGFLAPRINLTSITMKIGSANNATGLLIYNNGSTLPTGYYFWNGTEWRNVDNSTAVSPAFMSLNCASAVLSPSTYANGIYYDGYLKIPYNGGNGGKYQSGNPVTINGLTFQLKSDKLEYGDGELVFSVKGTPSVSSPTTTSISINNTMVPFLPSSQFCTATVGGQSTAEIKEVAVMGPLLLNNQGGYNNYHQMLTTPDGKFSIRVRVPENTAYGYADIEVRSNNSPTTIMFNYHTEYSAGMIVGSGNALSLPSAGVWYGNNNDAYQNGSPSTGSSSSWGDPDVYYFAPENRRYTWTTTNTSDKTMYEAVIMMGAPDANIIANSTNCPGGSCNSSKAYIIIKQIKAL
ncbi:hypothetical protein [Chryseobacterium culicis]|uniref:Gloeo_Verruco repeat-containing protein n=1 Tax=Chryseobacterium culicis TaxID=680127 RepID=A0A1H6HAH9_CHRCI|nr:hypothetical protein [Chryseobacterium culicis]SEH32496.1 hypothetical protein SAMN05421593_1819 [Chryseobacterium culicis]